MRCYYGSAALLPLIALAALLTILFVWNVETENTASDDTTAFLSLFISDPPVLFDLTDFRYLIEPSPCTPKTSLGTLLVTSHFAHVEMRSIMRRGYTTDILTGIGFRMIFLLAEPPPSEDYNWQQGAIKDEARRFGDILQGSFHEAYKNLTYKNTMGLLWAASKCNKSTFIAKMDDDIAVNVFEVAQIMHKQTNKPFELNGVVIKNGLVVRNPEMKWYITDEEFKGKVYPPYLTGWLYFGHTQLLGRIAHEATKLPYFFIDDAFLLGIVREKIFEKKVTFNDLKPRFTFSTSEVICCLGSPNAACSLIAGPTAHNIRLMLRFIRRAVKCRYTQKCLPPVTTLSSCTGDVRKLSDLLSQVEESVSIDGEISPVPL